jgi:hypothetical protein
VRGTAAFVRAERLSILLCSASIAASLPSLVKPSLLTGEPVTVGNVRGTALVVLVLTVPGLVLAMRAAGRGSLVGLALWSGATMALSYQALLFCFGIPFNTLFLPYVAMLGLSAWTLIALVHLATAISAEPWAAALEPSRFAPRALAALAVGNGVVWLGRVTPILWTGDQPEALSGSGLLTSPVWVQDLAFWIPAAVVVAVLTLRGNPLGHLLTGGMLSFYVIECVSVASDQWFGARADASHPDIASMDVVPPALALALLIVLPLTSQLRVLRRAEAGLARVVRPAITWAPSWRRTLGLVSGSTSVAALVGAGQLITGTFTPPLSDLRALGLHSWVLPGIWLAASVAVPCGVTAVLAWRRSTRLGQAAAVAGTLLLVELAVQIPFIGLDPLQAVMGMVAAALIWLGFASQHDTDRLDAPGLPPVEASYDAGYERFFNAR